LASVQSRLVRYAAGFGELSGVTNAQEIIGGTLELDEVT